MEQIRKELVEAGVIGRILDDFNPQLIMHLFYGDRLMSSGDEVLLADLRESPDYIGFMNFDPDGPGLRKSFTNPTLATLIMTDPDGPMGEYLHWMAMDFATIGHPGGSWKNVVEYEPPRSMATRMIVLTLFEPNVPFNYLLYSRENFSSRDFANAHGQPVAAAFFKIKKLNEANNFVEVNALGQPVGPAFLKTSEEEDDNPESDVDESNKCNTAQRMEVNALGQPVGPAFFKTSEEEDDNPESDVDESNKCNTAQRYNTRHENDDESRKKPKRF